jgi:hypothetical protein
MVKMKFNRYLHRFESLEPVPEGFI